MLAIQTSLETIEARIAQLNPSAAAAAAAGVGGPAALLTSVDGTMREAWAQSVRSIDRWEKHLNASLPLKPEWLPAKYLRVAVFGVVFVIGGTAGTYYLIGARWKKIAAEEVADLAEQVLAQRALKATVLATLDELAQDPETLDAPDPPDAGSDRPRNQQGDRGAPVGGDPRRTGATGHGQLREPVAVL